MIARKGHCENLLIIIEINFNHYRNSMIRFFFLVIIRINFS